MESRRLGKFSLARAGVAPRLLDSFTAVQLARASLPCGGAGGEYMPTKKKIIYRGSARTMMDFVLGSSTGIAARIFADGWASRGKSSQISNQQERRAAYTTELAAEIAAFTRDADNLFAAISLKFGPSKARKIFKSAMGGRGKRKREQDIDIDRALMFYCALTNSPRKTAKRAKELGLTGSLDTIERRVNRVMQVSRAATKASMRGGSDDK
jgi:hypothetical protein